MKKIVLAIVLAALGGAALAQQALKPEEAIKYRKAGYSFIAWNMGKIKASVEGEFNKEQVAAAANAIAAIANSGMGALYLPGTDKDIGNEKTRLKAEFFQQPDKAKEVGMGFVKEANELAKLAAGGDVAAIKAQLGKTGESCKACHDAFRNK